MMPKVNNNILAVQQANSNLIKIYNIKLRQFTRQFLISKDEPIFDDLNQRNESKLSAYDNGKEAMTTQKK